MKKNLIAGLLIIFSTSIFAQTLESHIPLSAECVISINGNSLTNKIGIKNIHKSKAFLDFAKSTIFTGNEDLKIGNIGIDLEKDLCFYYNSDTTMSYYAFMYEIEKPKLFERYIDEKNEYGEKVKSGNYNVLFYKNEKDYLAWNNEFAVYVYVDYFENESKYNYWGEYDYPVEAVETIEEHHHEGVESSEETQEEYEARQREIEAEKARIEAERIAGIRKKMTAAIEPLFSGVESKSILDNKGYTEGRDNKSDISFWLDVRKSGGISNYRYLYRYGYSAYRTATMMVGQYFGNEINANLYFKQNQILVNSNLKYSEKFAEYFRGIYSTRLPKNYMKYIEQSDVLGISSVSFNSQKIWEFYPKMYAELFRGYVDERNEHSEEIDVLLDFVAIMLDEKALGDIATGDAIVILKDLAKVKVEYKTYEYDENYTERKEVTKTKEEMFPEFLCMFGTRNKSFIEKLLNLACKNEVMYRQNEYYYTDGKNRDFPFKLYFMVKDDIAFVSSNLNEIQRIIDNETKPVGDKKLENNLLKNQGYVMVNIKQLLNRIDTETLGSKERQLLIYARENTENIQMFSNLEGEKVMSKVDLETPKSFKNSALYLWSFINEVYAIENGR